jgi:hypothetical protein
MQGFSASGGVDDDEAGHVQVFIVAKLPRQFLAQVWFVQVLQYTAFLQDEVDVAAQRAMKEIAIGLRLHMLVQVLAHHFARKPGSMMLRLWQTVRLF